MKGDGDRLAALEQENAELRAENAKLRALVTRLVKGLRRVWKCVKAADAWCDAALAEREKDERR